MQCTSVCAFDECITPREWNFPNITRPFSILYYVLGGTAFYTINGEEKQFQKGRLYLLPANTVFSLREDPRDKFYAVFVHAYTFPQVDRVVEVDAENDAFLRDTLEMLRRYVKNREGSVYVRNLVNMTVSYLFEEQRLARKTVAQKMKAYIENHFVTVFQDSDLSGVFNYSNSYLIKLYRNEFNLTPKQYATQLLLRESVLLLDGGFLIRDVASRLCFSSPENFSRFFKSYYGCAPSVYEKKYKYFPK